MTDFLHRYVTTAHRRVEGWLSETAIALLLDLARIQDAHGIRGPVCEIGVHHGRSLILLHLLTRSGERSVGWDLFEDQEQNIGRSGKGDRARLMANLRRHGCDLSRIDVVTKNSLDLTAVDVLQTCKGAPRIFSVDGGHTAEATYHDLALGAQAIQQEGLVVLDDFFNEPWPGVAEGTCRYLSDPPLQLYPVAIGGNKLILTKNRDMAALYARELRLPTRSYRRRDTIMFGHPVAVFTPHIVSLRTRLLRSRGLRAARKSILWRVVKRLGRMK
jgi:hypothetical protein